MAYNLGDTRISKDESSFVGDNSYVDVARAYYYSNMYSDNTAVINDVFDETIPVFNAVPKVVNIASALSVGGKLEPSYEDTEWVEDVVDNLGLEQEKLFMCRDLILSKAILCEVQNREDDDDDANAFENEETEFPYILSYYPSDEYEIISQGNRILYAKVDAVRLVYDPDKEEYVSEEVKKIFIRDDQGKARSWIEAGDERLNEVEYEGGILPLVEITTTYDMKQLFYTIDRHNELEAFSRNILFLAGEPILTGTGIDRMGKDTASTIQDDRYKKLKSLWSKSPDANLKMIEITGSSARVMLEKQQYLTTAITKDYPEYSISDVLSGSNVSEETTRIRLTEILSRVNEVRRNMETGINKIIALIAFFEGKESIKKYVKFDNLADSNIKDLLPILIQALDSSLISRESAMSNIKKLFIGEDVDVEKKRLEEEGKIDSSGMATQPTLSDNNTNTNEGDEENGTE